MLSLLLDDGLDDNRMVDGTGSHTLDALERSADMFFVMYKIHQPCNLKIPPSEGSICR